MMKWKKCLNSRHFCLIIFLSFFFVSLTFAQKTVKVRAVKGYAFVSGDISPNEARAIAVKEAKINALKAAGIAENIKSYELLFNSQNNNDFTQFFNSDIQSEIQGAVQSYEVKKEKITQNKQLELLFEVEIDASIISYDSKPDIAFNQHIEGIGLFYQNNQPLTFSLKSTQPFYLTVFNITNSESVLLYPNKFEKQEKFQSDVSYSFPSNKINYILNTTAKESEENMLIFVFTKSQIPYINMNNEFVTNSDAIFSWIYSILPDQRNVEYRKLIINK
jgi:hypothetical protein